MEMAIDSTTDKERADYLERAIERALDRMHHMKVGNPKLYDVIELVQHILVSEVR
jgi:hypothetical protein